MGQHLLEIEKICIRHAVCKVKYNEEKCIAKIHLRHALEQANGVPYHKILHYTEKERKAKTLQYNCFTKKGRKSCYVPVHFGAFILNGNHGLSSKSIRILQNVFTKKKKEKASNLNEFLPRSSASIYNIAENTNNIEHIKKEVREKFILLLISSPKIRNNKTKQEAINFAFKNINTIPWAVHIIHYKPKVRHGCVWHTDSYSTFGTAIIFLKDSKSGRLHIEGIDLPEQMKAGDIVFVDPNTRHKVEKAAREEERVVATIVF